MTISKWFYTNKLYTKENIANSIEIFWRSAQSIWSCRSEAIYSLSVTILENTFTDTSPTTSKCILKYLYACFGLIIVSSGGAAKLVGAVSWWWWRATTERAFFVAQWNRAENSNTSTLHIRSLLLWFYFVHIMFIYCYSVLIWARIGISRVVVALKCGDDITPI